ncbi:MULTISPECIES: YvrJ family protein [Fictibacillus]|uniref:YvrJ family protein n=1 Tax=Fictibacillus terranigra TaxID=3058424 RepID=A0ABT8E177_9BACL|nr:YvrJ family protein [Fictibacillus sp. CENA-BCM004]MDN4071656.1 YvrJ family protein [Fictibacillus sp. CENA-BCM004]
METWLSFVSDVGFPVMVTLYLLHRIEGKLDTLSQSIMSLAERVQR